MLSSRTVTLSEKSRFKVHGSRQSIIGPKNLIWPIQSLFKDVRNKRGWAVDILHLAMSMDCGKGIFLCWCDKCDEILIPSFNDSAFRICVQLNREENPGAWTLHLYILILYPRWEARPIPCGLTVHSWKFSRWYTRASFPVVPRPLPAGYSLSFVPVGAPGQSEAMSPGKWRGDIRPGFKEMGSMSNLESNLVALLQSDLRASSYSSLLLWGFFFPHCHSYTVILFRKKNPHNYTWSLTLITMDNFCSASAIKAKDQTIWRQGYWRKVLFHIKICREYVMSLLIYKFCW